MSHITVQLSDRRPCPHCGSVRVQGHGSFPRKDGTRQHRQWCRTCDRTFNEHTGTPLHYLKKRRQWKRLAPAMAQGLSVRRTAALLGIQVATSFRWRHRLLSALRSQPQPILTGGVAAGEAYVPYSEKGNRHTAGPRAQGSRRASAGQRPSGQRRFRRFIDGKPSCVLMACSADQQVVVTIGSGRPSPTELQACLANVLRAATELWTMGLAPYAEACRRLGVPHREAVNPRTAGAFAHLCQAVNQLCRRFYGWLAHFRGIATRYLNHYLVWYRTAGRIAVLRSADTSQLPVETIDRMPPRSAT